MVPGISVGIDYHKEALQVCVLSGDGRVRVNRKTNNDVGEVIRLIRLKGGEEVTVAAEACNGSAAFLDALHQETGWKVKLCHPGYAQRMRNNPDKSDKSDGELIADLTRIGYLPEVWLAPVELRDLRALVRYRHLQMKEMRAVKLRIRALLRNNRIVPPKECSLWSKAGKGWLSDGAQKELAEHSGWILSRYYKQMTEFESEVQLVTKRLKKFVDGDPFCQKLIKQRGIGLITAAVMRAEIGTFSRFKNGKQLARFCGVSPCNRSSGEVVSDCGLIRAGNTVLKSCLTQGVWTLIRYDERWKSFAASLKERGKPPGVIAAAVANRWIRGLFHQVKDI